MENISYIIPVFNAESTLEEAVDSIYNNNFREGDEVIIVNDASTDRSQEVAETLTKKYSGIRVFSHAINKGSAAAGRNTGIDHSQNELLFCLDADNILVPGSIEKLQKFMRETSSDCSAFGETHMFEKDISQVFRKLYLSEQIDLLLAINEVDKSPCSYGNYLLTKKSWKQAGRYNESLGGAYDSFAFGIAQLATGTKMTTLKGAAYLHRAGHNSAYMREYSKRVISLLFLQILLPYIHLIHPDDVNFIMGEGKLYWAEQLAARPLRGAQSAEKPSFSFEMLPEPPFSELLRITGRKIKRKLGGK